MASIRKRKNKSGTVYVLDIRHKGRRIVKTLGPNKKLAEKIAADYQLKLTKDDSGLFPTDRYIDKFKEELENYIRTNTRDKTASRYLGVLKVFIAFLKKENIKKLSSISVALIDRYKAHRLIKVRKSTVNSELKILQTFLNHAIRWNYIAKNPVDKVDRIPVVKKDIVRFFSDREIKTILDEAHQPYHDIFKIFIFTGMRLSELRFLRRDDIDFKKKRIYIRKRDDFAPKSSERTIPIHPNIEATLKENSAKTGLLFTQRDGESPVDHRLWLRWLQRILKKKRIPHGDIHTFRHTFASKLVMSGVDLRTVQRLLGHSDIKTTMIYSHLAEDHLDESIEKFDIEW